MVIHSKENRPAEVFADTGNEKNKIVAGMLYLVATPIGNLSDLSPRAVKVLSGVDFIAAEDTRNSLKLLSCLGIEKPLLSYYEHNKRERGEQIAQRLQSGQSCALITDAGTPAISDPGEDLVILCAQRGIPVTSIPGCCAAITALTLSGLPTARFTFEGFLPVEKTDRRRRLTQLKTESRTMIFHEAPHKLRATLSDFSATFGDGRRISLCRELTKLNEDITRTTIADAIAHYTTTDPRGEYVLVVEGSNAVDATPAFWENMTVEQQVMYYIAMGHTKMEAVKSTAKDRGVSKNEIYQQVLGLNAESEN